MPVIINYIFLAVCLKRVLQFLKNSLQMLDCQCSKIAIHFVQLIINLCALC